MEQRFSRVNVVGKYLLPFRQLTEEEEDELCAKINDIHPDLLWIGLGSPKEDVWIHNHLEKILGCIIVPSGATFIFFSGRKNKIGSQVDWKYWI